MVEMPGEAAHHQHHGPPTGFIRKHVFSLDHKVIGKQYYFTRAGFSVFTGMVLSWLLRIHLVWGKAHFWGLGFAVAGRRAGGSDHSRILPVADDAARHADGVLRADQRRRFAGVRQLRFLPIQIGAEDMAFPRPQHAVVLDHLRGPGFACWSPHLFVDGRPLRFPAGPHTRH
jgi:cytochrome c oxidase subunit 1